MRVTTDTESESARLRIKEAARIVFLKQGMEGARTQEIADLSHTSPTLINYYFKGKEKLFDEILTEVYTSFIEKIEKVVNAYDTDFETKVHLLADRYSEMVLENPHLPMSTLIKIRKKHRGITHYTNQMRAMLHHSEMAKQLQQRVKQGVYRNVVLPEMLMNLVALTLFPALAAPVLSTISDMKADAYNALIKSRQKHIADWVLHTLREPKV